MRGRVCRAALLRSFIFISFRLSMFHCSLIVETVSVCLYRALLSSWTQKRKVGELERETGKRYRHKRPTIGYSLSLFFFFLTILLLLLLTNVFFSFFLFLFLYSPLHLFNWPALISLFCWHGKNVYKIRRGEPIRGGFPILYTVPKRINFNLFTLYEI